ncbi:ABC transporter permease [Gordonia sp. NPDC003429]
MNNSIRTMFRSPMVIGLGIILVWFIITFLIVPNVRMIGDVFFPNGELSLRAFQAVWSSNSAMRALRNSFILAFALCITVNVLGIFIVLVTRYFDIKGSKYLWLGFGTALIYSGVVAVAGYKFVFGDNGIVTQGLTAVFPGVSPDWFTGAIGVITVLTLGGTGQQMLFLSAALAKVDNQTIEAAQQMGASNWKILTTVVLPTIKPMIFATTILTFLSGLSAFAAPQVLGGTQFQTIAPTILTFSNVARSRDLAIVLALILGLSTLILLAVLNRIQSGGTYVSVSKVPSAIVRQPIKNKWANVAMHVVAYALFLVYVLPPVLIVLYSFTDARTIRTGDFHADSFTLHNYAEVLTDYSALSPLILSVVYAGLTGLLVILLILPTARIITRFPNVITTTVDYLLHIPWVLPAAMIAVGFIVTFSFPNILVGNQVLTGTLVLLLIAYVAQRIPFTLRLLRASFAGIPQSMEEAASMLGAGDLYTFRKVLLPIVLPTAAAITALNFNSLLTEYDTAVFLANPFHQPLGIVIQNATRNEGSGDATAKTFVYTVLLMIISTFIMWLVYGRSSDENKRSKSSKRSFRIPGFGKGNRDAETEELLEEAAAPVTLGSAAAGP